MLNRNRMKNPISINESRERFIVALDEIEYCGEHLAARMGVATEYDDAKDCLYGLITRLEGLLEDIELMYDDETKDGAE